MHITFGDYTPRQQTVGFLESYLHGGVTTAISASEVHVPGRPRDADGVKALAVAAHKCFAGYRPGGMRVHAGSVILEPTLSGNDLGEIARKQGAYARARGLFEESLALHRQVGNGGGIAHAYRNLAGIAEREGDYERAAPLLAVAMECGFTSASHFSKAYLDHFGRAPSAERKGVQGGAAGRKR